MRSLIFFILLSFSFLAYSSDEGKSVVDLTVLNKLPKEKRDILKNEAEDFPSFWGMVKKSVNISGFDIYSTKKGRFWLFGMVTFWDFFPRTYQKSIRKIIIQL